MTLPKLCAALLLVPAVARADLFGVSDSKMIVQLTQMVNTLQAQLNTLQKTYDVGRELYDLAQRDNDKTRFYYGVTEDGIHGPWVQFVDAESDLLD